MQTCNSALQIRKPCGNPLCLQLLGRQVFPGAMQLLLRLLQLIKQGQLALQRNPLLPGLLQQGLQLCIPAADRSGGFPL